MRLIDLYKPIRRYSYAMTSVLLIVALAYFLIWQEFSLFGVLITGGVALGIFLLWLWLRPGTSEVSAAEQVYQAIGNGRPTFLNIYSNY